MGGMVSSSEIRGRLAEYLDREVGLREFEDWLVPNTWNIHLSGSKAAEILSSSIEERISAYLNHYISESRLREELSALAYHDTKLMNAQPQSDVAWSSSMSSRTSRVGSSQPSAGFGLTVHFQTLRQTNTVRLASLP